MEYHSDYETIASLEKFQQMITALHQESQQRLHHAQQIYTEAEQLQTNVQNALQDAQELNTLISTHHQAMNSEIEKSALQMAHIAAIEEQITSACQQVQADCGNIKTLASEFEVKYNDFMIHHPKSLALKQELSILRDQYTNLSIRHRYTSLALAGGLIISLLVAILR